jgi:kynurenine formamidase
MRLIDLTMPIWPGAGYGEILPLTNTSVEFFEYVDYQNNGMRVTRMKLNGETGSPLMVPQQHAPFIMIPIQPDPKYKLTLSDIPLDKLVLRDTVILDIPAGEAHEIIAGEMEQALARSDFRKGDCVLLRTGWGSKERAYAMGVEYLKRSPCMRYDAGALLAKKMEELDSLFFMADCALVNPPRVQGYGWFTGDNPLTPLPKPWPSMEARERVMDMGGAYAYAHTSKEPSSYGALIKRIIGGCSLVDCHLISKPRVKMIIMPMFIKQGGASPCRFIAVEED